MKWEECLKIRWQLVEPEKWAIVIDGVQVAIVQDNGTYFNWSAGGQFDWNPTRRGAMRAARWAFWVNRAPRYSASVILSNNS
jgi:hypothetical protein